MTQKDRKAITRIERLAGRLAWNAQWWAPDASDRTAEAMRLILDGIERLRKIEAATVQGGRLEQ